MGRFDGKVAIITGAAGGVGKGCALRMAKEGCIVVLTDVKSIVEDTAKEIMKAVPGSICKGVVCDVTKSEQVDKLVSDTAAEFGKLDIMFNNAGINHAMCEVANFEDAVFDRVININFRGIFNGCRAAIRQMIKQGEGGRIVNTASYYAKRGYGYFAPYCASKAAVVNFTRSFAYEAIKHKVYVNCICPGDLFCYLSQMRYICSLCGKKRRLRECHMRKLKPLILKIFRAGDSELRMILQMPWFICALMSVAIQLGNR